MSNKEEILDQEELEVAENVETVEEETLAAKSIAPKGKAMFDVMAAMSKMSGPDLNKFLETMKQFAPNKDYGVGDNSAKNKATVAMKEDLDTLFDGYELSEEFKDTASTLFEAALGARIIAETTRLEEEYAVKLEEQMTTFSSEMVTKIDSYLNYAVENFMKENEVAIESALRNELTEEFIEGLRTLFAEHYISVPQDKVDVLEALAEKVEQLESKLNEAIVENTELRSSLDILQKEKEILLNALKDFTEMELTMDETRTRNIQLESQLASLISAVEGLKSN